MPAAGGPVPAFTPQVARLGLLLYPGTEVLALDRHTLAVPFSAFLILVRFERPASAMSAVTDWASRPFSRIATWSRLGPNRDPGAACTSGLGRRMAVKKPFASNPGSGQPWSRTSSRMRLIPVPAFSMKAMRCSRSAMRALRRTLWRPRAVGGAGAALDEPHGILDVGHDAAVEVLAVEDVHLVGAFRQQARDVGLVEEMPHVPGEEEHPGTAKDDLPPERSAASM